MLSLFSEQGINHKIAAYDKYFFTLSEDERKELAKIAA